MCDIREYRPDELIALLPLPAPDANKYTRGTLTAIVGSRRYPGAACLAAHASQRMGAGYTQVLTSPDVVSMVQTYRPSVVVRSWNTLTAIDFATNPHKTHAYLLGSGFDAADTRNNQLVYHTLKHAEDPVLIDGSGLYTLTSEKGRRLLKRRFVRGWETVITPHAGEAARLAQAFDLPTDNPAELARLLSLALGATAVVKGPLTFVSDGNEIIRVASGTPALAKAGTGDVLAGMIGALLAQGLTSLDAAVLGVELHAQAGQSAAKSLTTIATCAEDVIDHIPNAIISLVNA